LQPAKQLFLSISSLPINLLDPQNLKAKGCPSTVEDSFLKKINTVVSPPQHQNRKPCTAHILAESPLWGQSRRYKRLAQAVSRRELTTSLEILAESQIEGDLAIFIIASIQALEVVS